MMRLKRGQSTLEYLILITMIIGVIIILAADAGGLRTGIQNVFTKSGAKIDKATAELGE